MKTSVALLLLALAAVFGSKVQATPLEEIHALPVSRLEFSSLKLELALAAVTDWPFPIEGASVSFKVNPDRIDIVIAVKTGSEESFRTACARTLGRVRQFLYVDAEGNAPLGRSYLGSYFRGPWRGDIREAALRALDASTRIQVNVVKRGTCHAALMNAPVKFDAISPN